MSYICSIYFLKKYPLFMKINLNRTRLKRPNFYLKELWNSSFFVFFAFANYFLPFFMCLMAGITKSGYSIQYVFIIGMASGFLVNFLQIGSILCMTLSFGKLIYKHEEGFKSVSNNEIFTFQLITVLFLSVILMPIYFGITYMFLHFIGGYKNTLNIVSGFGLDFLGTTTPSVLLMTLNTFFIYKIFFDKNKNWKSVLLIFINLIINSFFVFIFGYYVTQLSMYSYGVGLIVGNLISLIVNLVFICSENIPMKLQFTIKMMPYIKTLGKVWNLALVSIYGTILRSIILMIVSLSLKVNTLYNMWNYMMATILWYHTFYLLLFVNGGLTQQISYLKVKNCENRAEYYTDALKFAWVLPLFAILSSTSLVLAYNWLMGPIASVYISNYDPSLLEGPKQLTHAFVYGKGSITSFMREPYSKAYVFTGIFVVFVTLSTSLGSVVPFKLRKSTKEDVISMISGLIVESAVLAFIIGFGVGVKIPSLPYMQVYCLALLITGIVFLVLKGLGVLGSVKKIKKLWNEESCLTTGACKRPYTWNIEVNNTKTK